MHKLSERNVYTENLFLARMPLHPRILQELIFIVRILQDFLILQDLARNEFSVN